MYVLFGIIGAIVGAFVGQGVAGGVAGFAIGVLWARTSRLRNDLDEALRRLGDKPAPAPIRERLDEQPVTPVAWPDNPAPAPRPIVPPPMPVAEPVAAYEPPPAPAPSIPAGPSIGDRIATAIKRWFTEGNVPVKVGMLVLFAGVAAFLKYATDAGLLHIPLPVRLIIVALLAIAGVAFGWIQRDKRRAFALSLQGGSIGVLVMTVFVAYRLYALIDSLPAFVLLVIFVGGLGVLAVLQDALALAVLGLVAGFAAPIIASSGQGSHVVLFTYYAVLNLGILGIAWKKAWRVLNVLGFVATFGVGTAWGVLRYSPGLFASTEPFLVLHFLLYLAVPWLHVLRSPDQRKAILDGCLMFGNPIACLILQAALLDWQPMPLAISAIVAAALYVGIAFAVRHRDDMRLLRDTWAVLAVAFATVAVPLALSASATAAVFALEGAGLIWLGFRQSRPLPRWTGVLLQVVAAAAWSMAVMFDNQHDAWPLINGHFLGAVLIVAGAAVGAWQFDHHGRSQGMSSLARVGLALWALAWWGIGVGREIDIHAAGAAAIAAWIALIGVTAWPVAEAGRRARKLDLGATLAFIVPALFLLGIVVLQVADSRNTQPLAGYPLLAVVATGVAGWFAMRAIVPHPVAVLSANVLWWARWLALAAVATDVAFGAGVPSVGAAWITALFVAPTLLLTASILWWPRPLVSPVPAPAKTLRLALGTLLLAGTVVIGIALLGTAASSRPLPFVPVLNPIDLLLLAVVVLVFRALSDTAVPADIRVARPVVFAVCVFAVATSATLRSVHHLGGVPWGPDLMASSLAQLSLTVVWSAIGVLAWVVGSRRGLRMLWLAGACIMALVLAKLLLVDRGHLGNLFGIGSFMAYGLLCTLVGYLAPAPPRQPSESPHAS
ncbi:DUF2339 domain-containing protein [Luteibacter sp. CQ10]|uniref:DUF2339 domain-containing protein n=1 Tax=Luteibacter sp. CQ10 TaxID=2805821 RepID=UPI0034A5C9D5